jgi:arsenate reductase (thioredoxin)
MPDRVYMNNRIAAFTGLPLRSIDKLSLGARLRDIGRGEGSTTGREKAG